MGEKRTRSVEFEEPSATASGAIGKTGIEFLREVIAARIPAAPLQATLGFVLLEATDGFAKFELLPGEHLYGPLGAVHGGVAATLLDSAMGAAVITTLDTATGCSTASLSVHFTRPITARTLKVLAEGWVVHRGSRLVTAEGRLNDEQGRLLAHGSATLSLSERPTQ
jgi:uncharacterized protein (TIGR00369 family)